MSSPLDSPAADRPRIAVIGGGISGLAAAHRLVGLLPNAEIDLFEASGRLGGVLNTVKRSGFLIEQSADNFLVKPSAALDLCRELGVAEELLTTDESRRRAFVVRGGKLVPIPEGFYLMSPRKLWPLLKSPVLSWRGKLRLLAEPLIRRRVYQGDEAGQRAGDDESIADFARRRLGREVFEQLVQPLVAGIYTADPEQLSMAATMPQFLELERKTGSVLRGTLYPKQPADGSIDEAAADSNHAANSVSGARYGLFVAPRDGMSELVATLVKRLSRVRVSFNSRVSDVRFDNQKWQVIGETQAPIANAAFDALVVSLPAPAAAGVLKQCDAALAAELATIEYSGCAVVSLGFSRQQIGHALDGFGFVVPETERRRIIAGSFASLKFPGRAPEHHVLVRVFIGGALQPEMLKLSDGELLRIAQEELNQLLQIAGAPVVTDVVRWPSSMPQYHVGHLERVNRIEQFAARHATLALAGNAYRGVGIPQCVASGVAAAERIASVLSEPGVS